MDEETGSFRMKSFWNGVKRRYYRYQVRRKNAPAEIKSYLEGFAGLDLKIPVTGVEFVAFDTETTGFHAKKGDRIVSISALRLKEGRIDLSDIFHEMVNPNRDIPSTAAVVHEILPRMVNGKPTIDDVLPRFISYIGTAVLVAHHAWLDMSFLNREMVRLYGFPIQNVVLDTAILDQALVLMKTPQSLRKTIQIDSSLNVVAARYRVSIEDRHSSFWDALATAQIFQSMIKQTQQNGVLCLDDLRKMALFLPRAEIDKQGLSPM
jgi:DNA polymerase III subunit epsilon